MKHEKSHFDLYVMKAAMLGTRVKGVNVRLNQNMILWPIQSEDMNNDHLFDIWVIVQVEERSKDLRVIVLADLNTT